MPTDDQKKEYWEAMTRPPVTLTGVALVNQTWGSLAAQLAAAGIHLDDASSRLDAPAPQPEETS